MASMYQSDTGQGLKVEELPGRGRSLGLLRISGVLLALTLESIREVIPGQAHYSPIAADAAGVAGAVILRGAVIPVLDPRQRLGMKFAERGQHVVLIIRREGQIFGLIADEVCGICNIPEPDLFELTVNKSDSLLLATHSFHLGNEVGTLLDARRIIELENLPTVADESRVDKHCQVQEADPIVLFSIERWHLAIEASFVDSTVPNTEILRTALSSDYCLGVIDHHGYEVPVVHTPAALGLGPRRPYKDSAIIVLRFSEASMLGIVIDQVQDIARIPRSKVLKLPHLDAATQSLFSGMIEADNGFNHLLLDFARLCSAPQLASLAGLSKPRLEAGVCGTFGKNSISYEAGSKAPRRPFLTYVAGFERASPLEQVTEIVCFPKHFSRFEESGTGLVGFFAHRNQTIPLISLKADLGRDSELDRENTHVLVVSNLTITVGYIIDRLKSIEMAEWNWGEATVPYSNDSAASTGFVLLGSGAQRRMVENFDLQKHALNLSNHV